MGSETDAIDSGAADDVVGDGAIADGAADEDLERELEAFWGALLSSKPARIRRAWRQLTDEEAQAALAHLRKMATEPGWQPAQQQAAADALRVIQAQAED